MNVKKTVALCLALVALASVTVPSTPADAQVVLSRKCCDASGQVRCIINEWAPVGTGCYCFGQGNGYVC